MPLYICVGYKEFLSHFLRAFGLPGNENSAETDVGPAAATTLKAGDFPYLWLSCLRNANQWARYTLSQGIGSLSTAPLPGPYCIANISVFAPSSAHGGEKKPGKMSSCTHLFDASAAAKS